MTSARRSILPAAVECHGHLVLFFGSTAFLARLLEPRDFGAYAVIGALVLIIRLAFQKFGGVDTPAQMLSQCDVRITFTAICAFAAATAVTPIFPAGPAVRFFGQPCLKAGITITILSFGITPFVVSVSVLHRRGGDHRRLAWCNRAVTQVGAVSSAALALQDFSCMAPMFGGLAGNAALAAVCLPATAT